MNITIANPTPEQFAELLKMERERTAAIEESERMRTAAITKAAFDICQLLPSLYSGVKEGGSF